MPRTEPIKAVRGVRDILPSEIPRWRAAQTAAAEVAERFGYQEIITPILEPAELIERAGEDTDAFAKELYRFADRGDRQLALRPEATAGVLRAYFERNLNQGPQPSRLYLLGPMFRYDRPQKGRYRQFYQLDVEAIGSASPALDAEVIEIATAWITEVGLGDPRLELNTIGDASCRPAYLEKLRAYYRPLASRLSADSQRRLEANPLRLLDSKAEEDAPFKAGVRRTTDTLCPDGEAHWSWSAGCSTPPRSSTSSTPTSSAASITTRARSSSSSRAASRASRTRWAAAGATTAWPRPRDGPRRRRSVSRAAWTASPT